MFSRFNYWKLVLIFLHGSTIVNNYISVSGSCKITILLMILGSNTGLWLFQIIAIVGANDGHQLSFPQDILFYFILCFFPPTIPKNRPENSLNKLSFVGMCNLKNGFLFKKIFLVFTNILDPQTFIFSTEKKKYF